MADCQSWLVMLKKNCPIVVPGWPISASLDLNDNPLINQILTATVQKLENIKIFLR